MLTSTGTPLEAEAARTAGPADPPTAPRLPAAALGPSALPPPSRPPRLLVAANRPATKAATIKPPAAASRRPREDGRRRWEIALRSLAARRMFGWHGAPHLRLARRSRDRRAHRWPRHDTARCGGVPAGPAQPDAGGASGSYRRLLPAPDSVATGYPNPGPRSRVNPRVASRQLSSPPAPPRR